MGSDSRSTSWSATAISRQPLADFLSCMRLGQETSDLDLSLGGSRNRVSEHSWSNILTKWRNKVSFVYSNSE